MIAVLDSATPPNVAQVAAAKAVGVAMWNGYLATKPGVKLYRPWTRDELAVVKALPGQPLVYASGWDDPTACKAQAAVWEARLCLDVEDKIRSDGPWVQGWLDASGAGLYGVSGVHPGRRAAFHVAAWYVSRDPGVSWPANWPRPTGLCGWQWQNTHNEFGVGVDRCWFDDGFVETQQEEREVLILDTGTAAKWLLDGGQILDIDSAATLAGLAQAGVKTVRVTQAFVDGNRRKGSQGTVSGSLTVS